MSRQRNRVAAAVLAIILFAVLLPVAAMAAGPVEVTWYTDGNFDTVDSRASSDYDSIYDAVAAISGGDFVTIKVGPASRGDSTTVTINKAATIRLSNEAAVTMFGGGIILDHADADLTISDFFQSASGTAINVRRGRLVLNSGAKIIGTSNGVTNTSGTVYFGGGQVSSYAPAGAATTIGVPSYITSSATPTPTPTPSNNAVTGVAVSPANTTMAVGKTQQLTATVLPTNASNKNVRWTTSDSSVATVSSSGLLRAVGTGGAYIRCTTVDGGYTYFVDVIVTEGTVSVTGISGLSRTTSVSVGGSTTLRPTIAPANASNKKLRWTSSNNAVATVSSGGVVRGVKAGTAVIRAITHDGGYTVSTTVTVSAASTPAPAAAVSTDIARNVRLTLDGSSIGGKLARSSSYVAVQPKSHNQVLENRLSVQVRAFNRLEEDGYATLRYRITPFMVDLKPAMSSGMGDNDRLSVTMQRLNNNTMSSSMYSHWRRSYSSKNISGPWEVNTNSNKNAMVLRVRLSKNISKSKMRVLEWSGSSFKSMSTSKYGVVRIGDQYYVRIDNVGDGVYAVVYR